MASFTGAILTVGATGAASMPRQQVSLAGDPAHGATVASQQLMLDPVLPMPEQAR
ncbi:MAG TPA: hypothetical protein VE996_06225 [Terriglobales bacterium]|nr:hypothetical protein [Terriglobales bacterium]